LFFCRLGDMVMLTRLLNLLRRRYRAPCQVIGTGSWTSSLYLGNPDVDGVWSFHRHLPFVLNRAWQPVRRILRDSAPGPIYICERHHRQLPRIRRILWLSGVDPARCVYLTDPGPAHLIDRLMELGTRTPPALRAMDYPVPPLATVDGPRLHILPSERAGCERWLAAQGWSERPRVLLQPGNHRSMGARRGRWRRRQTDDKWWPVAHWAQLLRLMHAYRSDAVLMLRGAREELPMLEEIRAVAQVPTAVVVGNSLRELFALAATAHSMISVDTGPAHAAAALSVPLVVLYGAESAQQWLPRSPTGTPVLGVGGPPWSTRADQIPVEAVFEAWRSLAFDQARAPSSPARAQRN
jgi:heptosyltransferase-2/heptosyltransferase-3